MKSRFHNPAKNFFNRSPEFFKLLPKEIKFQVLLGKNFFTQKLLMDTQKTAPTALRILLAQKNWEFFDQQAP